MLPLRYVAFAMMLVGKDDHPAAGPTSTIRHGCLRLPHRARYLKVRWDAVPY
jgi:hypothetical protein